MSSEEEIQSQIDRITPFKSIKEIGDYHITTIGWDLSDNGYIKAVNVNLKNSQSNIKNLYFKYEGEGKQLEVPSGATVEDYLNLTCKKIYEITENKDYEIARALFIMTFFKDPYTGEDTEIDDDDIDEEDMQIDNKSENSMRNIHFKYLQEIKLDLDNGTTGKFKFLEQIQLNGESYIVLLPDGGNGAIVNIYKLKIENNAILRFLRVEDKEVENKVLNIYNKGEHNYLNRKTKKSTGMSDGVKKFLIFIIVTIILAFIWCLYTNCLPSDPIEGWLMYFVVCACGIAIIPSIIITGIICGLFGIGTKSYKNSDEAWEDLNNKINTMNSIKANSRAIELECQANQTKDPNLKAQLRAQAAQLRLLNK